jgi:4-hydroxy-tetrahydrodipicolinate reductase
MHALRGIISHPELELVGLVVHSDYKAGRDAGELAGVASDQTKVAVEHVTRTREDQASDWPRGLAGDAYRVVIDGSPHLDCEFNFREGDDHLAGGFNITAMRAVNAIPALCEADPGVVSTFDLPPVTGRGRVA